MKDRLKFLLKVLVLSATLYLVGDVLLLFYNLLLGLLYQVPLLDLPREFVVQGYNSGLRMIPYLALLLATPEMSRKHRSVWLAGGMVVFIAMDAIMTAVWGGPPTQDLKVLSSESHYTWSLIWDTTGHWVLPLLLWIAAAHRQIRATFGASGPVELPS